MATVKTATFVEIFHDMMSGTLIMKLEGDKITPVEEEKLIKKWGTNYDEIRTFRANYVEHNGEVYLLKKIEKF